MGIILVILFIGGIIYLVRLSSGSRKKSIDHLAIDEIEKLLNDKIDFYNQIKSTQQKENFKQRVIHFMQHVKFTSVGQAKHELIDEVYIASSAIIPIFSFPDWEYQNIREVLIYDDHFNYDFKVDEDNHIMGMVGDGAMNNTMVLSQRALREGFEKNEGSQTALHEFIHLIDKADGSVDGVPEYLIPKTLVMPWLRHIRAIMVDIKEDETNINPYASTNESEFFAVISEYFFEKPAMLQREHPILYDMLNRMFKRYDDTK